MEPEASKPETQSEQASERLECKICWYVYDPELGDPVWQIPPGTAFADLPESWSCPECDSDKDGFLVIR